MIIRQATRNDVSLLTQLKKPKTDAHKGGFESNQLKRLEDIDQEKAIYLVAQEDRTIVGHVFVAFSGSQTEPNYPHLQDLYVDETKRSIGIGRKLIQTAEAISIEKGFNKISLCVNPTLNPRAKALYERLGYEQTRTKPYLDGVYDGVEDWCVDMVKKLE